MKSLNKPFPTYNNSAEYNFENIDAKIGKMEAYFFNRVQKMKLLIVPQKASVCRGKNLMCWLPLVMRYFINHIE